MRISNTQIARWGKAPVFLLLALPALWLAAQWLAYFAGEPHGLGFNPQEFSNRFSGRWTLRILILALSVSPLADLSGSPWPRAFRRMVGLFAFFYASLHLSSYVVLDQFFDWGAVWKDIEDRIYITLGIAAFTSLIPLAVTSTNRWIKRLGAARWKRLHRLVYLAAALAATHFLLLAKGNQVEPKIYAVIIAFLLGYRLVKTVAARSGSARMKMGAPRG